MFGLFSAARDERHDNFIKVYGEDLKSCTVETPTFQNVCRTQFTDKRTGEPLDPAIVDSALDIIRTTKPRAMHGSDLAGYFSRTFARITEAEAPQTQARRLSTLQMLAPYGLTLLDQDTFWQALDRGDKPRAALAEAFKVKRNTIEEAFRYPFIFSGFGCEYEEDLHRFGSDFGPDYTVAEKIRIRLQRLDKISPLAWPKTAEDEKWCDEAHRLAKQTIERFNGYRDSKRGPYEQGMNDVDWSRMYAEIEQHFGSFAVECQRQDGGNWQAFLERKLKKELMAVAEKKKSGQLEDAGYDLFGGDPFRVSPKSHPIKLAIEERFDRIEGVFDMQNSFYYRLYEAAQLLAFRSNGYEVTDRMALYGLPELDNAFWQMALPSERLASSSYWHSSRVVFQDRFKSLSYDDATEWRGLFDKPLTAPNGVTLEPLISRTMLEDEAKAMRHCVWSYTDRCISGNLHLFSLSDANGTQLSTLSVRDADDNGQRKIRLHQNAGIDNTEPTLDAKIAGQWLVDSVNNGTLRPNWDLIDTTREKLQSESVERSVGYDYQNPETREAMFQLYTPCLPRKALRRHGRTFDAFFASLGVNEAVQAFLAKPDAAEYVRPLAPQAPSGTQPTIQQRFGLG